MDDKTFLFPRFSISIDDVETHDENPKTHNPEQYQTVKRSFEEFPEMVDIRRIVLGSKNRTTKKYKVIGGNLRLQVARDLGYCDIPVIDASGLPAAQQKEFMIRDNVVSGEWDFDILLEEWAELPLGEWGVELPKEEPPNLGGETGGEEDTREEVTFLFAPEQLEVIEAALVKAKRRKEYKKVETFGNDDHEANALYSLFL